MLTFLASPTHDAPGRHEERVATKTECIYNYIGELRAAKWNRGLKSYTLKILSSSIPSLNDEGELQRNT